MKTPSIRERLSAWVRSIRPSARRMLAIAMIPIAFAVVAIVEPALLVSSQLPRTLAIADEPHLINQRLRSEEAFLTARQRLAGITEVSLAVNLSDSTAVLSIEGVPVRVSTATRIDRSALLERRSSDRDFLNAAQTPFRVVRSAAPIPHIPIRVVEAPKDTAEARLRPPEAFAPDDGYVWAELQLDRDVLIILEPEPGEGSWRQRTTHSVKGRVRDGIQGFMRFVRQDDSLPPLWIRLEMPSREIRAIYRALPEGGQIAIHF